MLGRLGDVLYWAASGLAVFILTYMAWMVFQAEITDYTFVWTIVGFVVLVWLFGRACRYVLSGR
jgi:hypothetical protein